jgi:hypothetical protein
MSDEQLSAHALIEQLQKRAQIIDRLNQGEGDID